MNDNKHSFFIFELKGNEEAFNKYSFKEQIMYRKSKT